MVGGKCSQGAKQKVSAAPWAPICTVSQSAGPMDLHCYYVSISPPTRLSSPPFSSASLTCTPAKDFDLICLLLSLCVTEYKPLTFVLGIRKFCMIRPHLASLDPTLEILSQRGFNWSPNPRSCMSLSWLLLAQMLPVPLSHCHRPTHCVQPLKSQSKWSSSILFQRIRGGFVLSEPSIMLRSSSSLL